MEIPFIEIMLEVSGPDFFLLSSLNYTKTVFSGVRISSLFERE